MKRSSKYVALDVHQATTVVTVRDETGRIIHRAVVPTDRAAIVEFFRGMRGTVHVTFEEGTQAQWLYDILVPLVHRVVVCNRRGEAPLGNKADKLDADGLSERLRCGSLRAVYHGSPERAALKELARSYMNVVEDATRSRGRLKALFRARAIRTKGASVYEASLRTEWLSKLGDPGARLRAATLYAQLEALAPLRATAKSAMIAEAKRDPAWRVLRSVPYLGPVRVALLFATVQTPWRFRTKRHLWSYAGLAVVTRTSAEYELQNGRPVRRHRAPLTRGLNRNHNPIVKNVFKGAALAAVQRPGPLQDFYNDMQKRGMRPELAAVTLARKLAALTLHVWKTGERYDPVKLTTAVVPAR
jgi:transposase